MGGCRQRGDVSVPPKGSGPKPRPGEVGPVEALGRPTGHEWKGTASLSMQRDPMGTDGDPWPQGEVRATPGQTVRAADARARQTRPSPGTEAGQGQRWVVSCSLQSQLTQGGSQGTPGWPGPPRGQGPVPGLGGQGAFRGMVRPRPTPTGSPVPALGSWASHSPSDRIFKGDAGIGGGGPRASGILGSDVGGGWERQARPQGPPVAHEAG